MSFTPRNNRFSGADFDDNNRGDPTARQADIVARWIEQVGFENRVRAMVARLRPHRAQRLAGWKEYRVRGHGLRVSIAWDPARRQDTAIGRGSELSPPVPGTPATALDVPCMVEVLEAILVGSATRQDDLHAHEEFEMYASVVRELSRRLSEMRSRYD